MDISDSSHSGMVAGAKCRRRVGLDGAEAAKRVRGNEGGNLKRERGSQSGFRFELLVGEERGGVTGALLDIRRGGSELGIEDKLWRKGRM